MQLTSILSRVCILIKLKIFLYAYASCTTYNGNVFMNQNSYYYCYSNTVLFCLEHITCKYFKDLIFLLYSGVKSWNTKYYFCIGSVLKVYDLRSPSIYWKVITSLVLYFLSPILAGCSVESLILNGSEVFGDIVIICTTLSVRSIPSTLTCLKVW